MVLAGTYPVSASGIGSTMERIRSPCPASMLASAMAIITAKARPTRARIFAMPRMKCTSKPYTRSSRELIRSSALLRL